jgi:excisionase family DNA binding protein
MVMDTLNANEVATDELDALREAAGELETKTPNSPLASLLAKLAMDLSQGRNVVLLPEDAQLSPAQVAKILGMSRPHLCKLLDAGAMPYERVGRDRRIKLREVSIFMRKREEARKELAETFGRAGDDRTALVAKLAGVDADTARRLGF